VINADAGPVLVTNDLGPAKPPRYRRTKAISERLMVDRQFFDTDILVCAFAADDPRNARAEVLIAP
jgi:hypothetical protein